MKTIMYLVGYNKEFIKVCNTGWGCGYVMIPTTHPIVIKWINSKNDDNYTGYLSIDADQEITYTEEKSVNGIDYIVIGFDTAHSYNNIDNCGFDYVFNETIKLQNLIDNFKISNND
jgi:hypothetical protein